jgi:hypothetical protein
MPSFLVSSGTKLGVWTAVFTLEYLLRIIVADHKPKFIFSFFGMMKLVAILPFYIAAGIERFSARFLRTSSLGCTHPHRSNNAPVTVAFVVFNAYLLTGHGICACLRWSFGNGRASC